jgi:nitrogen fixation/metabolism regulation signal transduction histidine kinase
MLLLTSFLLLAIGLVYFLDRWAHNRIGQEVERQNRQVKEVVNSSFGAFAQALSLAMQSLDKEEYLYERIDPQNLPITIKHIIIADQKGRVVDSTSSDLVKGEQRIPVPEKEEARESSSDPTEKDRGGLLKTYYLPIRTIKGLYWIVIVEQRQVIIDRIESASRTLAGENRKLSNIRILSTTGLLALALVIAVVIGWQFTRPIKELVDAARRIAAGELDFSVNANRRDEIGGLASTFNEMISGLRAKRELEEKLNQAERAAVIGRLTQSIAHEIRNPLNLINLSIDHVRTKFAPEDEKIKGQFTQLLSSIKDEIARLNRMVSDLLSYGRPSQLSMQVVDMRKLIEETISLIGQQAKEQGVEVNLEDAAESAEVLGDRERLKSCLSNLAINALEAMPSGGRIQMRLGEANGFVEITISDTGTGIDPEAMGRIFEPYFSTKRAGFGLGLAITKKIIEEHRGSIEVHSQLGAGTTFRLKLPAAGSS